MSSMVNLLDLRFQLFMTVLLAIVLGFIVNVLSTLLFINTLLSMFLLAVLIILSSLIFGEVYLGREIVIPPLYGIIILDKRGKMLYSPLTMAVGNTRFSLLLMEFLNKDKNIGKVLEDPAKVYKFMFDFLKFSVLVWLCMVHKQLARLSSEDTSKCSVFDLSKQLRLSVFSSSEFLKEVCRCIRLNEYLILPSGIKLSFQEDECRVVRCLFSRGRYLSVSLVPQKCFSLVLKSKSKWAPLDYFKVSLTLTDIYDKPVRLAQLSSDSQLMLVTLFDTRGLVIEALYTITVRYRMKGWVALIPSFKKVDQCFKFYDFFRDVYSYVQSLVSSLVDILSFVDLETSLRLRHERLRELVSYVKGIYRWRAIIDRLWYAKDSSGYYAS